MLLINAIQEYLCALGGHSIHTRRSAKTILLQFAAWAQGIALEQLTIADIRHYQDYLRNRQTATGSRLADNTLHTHTRRIKTFLVWCLQEEEFSDLVSERMVRRIALPKVASKVMRLITPGEFERLYEACGIARYTGQTQRNRAILCLLYDTGIRSAELCGLHLAEVYFLEGDNFLRVLGKGRKQREVGFGQRTRKALRVYIYRHRKASQAQTHVFLSRRGSPLTPSGLEQILYHLADKAGIERISAHKFRHSFAVNYLQRGGDLFKLSRLLGHESIQTTQRYLSAFSARDARTGGLSVLDQLKQSL